MVIPKGYKQTEVGVIPEDWDLKEFGSVVKINRGGSPRPIQDYITQADNGVNWIKIGDVREDDKYITSTKEKIIPEGVSRSRPVHAGDFILSNSMSFGRPYILAIDGCIHDGWLTIQKYDQTFSKEYLYYLLSSDFVYQQYISMVAGSSVKNLNKEKVAALVVTCPDLKEQEEIARSLSDIDSLIVSFEKLISKKKAIKQGAMQELLTGKRRLPGFSEEWNNFNLMKHSKIKARIGWQGLKKSEYLDNGYALLVTGTDFDDGRVQWDSCHYVTRTRYEQDRNIQLQNNDILITKDGSLGKAALVQGLTKPATLNSGIFVIRPMQNAYDSIFVYHILSSFVFKNFLDKLSAGSTIIHLYQKDVGKFEFLLPPTIAEQKAIAAVLSEMDVDIAALEEKLAKYRQVKQGMMQQLLTGKIRLTNDADDSVQTEQVTPKKAVPSRTAHNQQFDDAVSIAAIVDAFYSDKYPLGRVKVQKLLYLLHRHQDVSVSDFKKKAAGPYADAVRYKGGEPIAKKNKYIVSESGKQGTRYSKGENMAQALKYVERWGMQADLQWLKENFLHTSRNDLELFATVDMAICDLNEAGIPVSVESIKELIDSNKEWKAKLAKTYFSDWDIARAIKKCAELFI
jgi:type I restriction enzyme S subunit